MAYQYSDISLARIYTCHPDLQRLALAVIKRVDATVLCGKRDEVSQEMAFNGGTSNAHYGESPHNLSPSWAIDMGPYPVRWDRWSDWAAFAKIVLEEAALLNLKITWGGSFQTRDGPHFELDGWRKERDKQFGG